MTARWEQIGISVLSGTASSVSFQNINDQYRKFRVVAYLLKDGSNDNSGGALRFNGDSTSIYAMQYLQAFSTTVTAARAASQAQIRLYDTFDADGQALLVVEVAKPTSSKVARVIQQAAFPEAPSGAISVGFRYGEWAKTDALINRIDIITSTGNFVAGTRIVLYGARDI